MCGIVGIVDQSDNNIKKNIENMLGAIYKRGPDGEGRYSEDGIELGMRRLSIIDLEGGQQPFYSNHKKIIAFQNGEIYNHIELKEELEKLNYKFISHSDTEVLAHGYAAWGMRTLLQKLEGMYAISILDKEENKLYLGRDRFGEKPLYYAINKENKQFSYSSDMRTIKNLDWIDNKLSPIALSKYLMLGFTVGEDSIVESIKKVLPAHYMSLALDTFDTKFSCYYLPDTNKREINNKQLSLKDKLTDSIELRLRSDVPVGVFLSGGIDSSLVAAMSAKKHEKIDTFSIGFHSDMHDESKYAKEVAKYIGSNHHHFMFDEDNFVSLLPIVVKELDEPLADQASLPTYWLSKEARKYVTVVLSGEGADEIFGGYNYYKQFEQSNTLSTLTENNQSITPSGFPLLMSSDSCKSFMNVEFEKSNASENQLFDWLDTIENGIQKAMTTDLSTWLPDDLLVKLDRMAMANSLEGRTPYLSHHVVDFAYSLEESDWILNDEYKKLLREVAKDYLPSSIFNRPKQGFVLPMDEWIIKWFKKESVEDFFYTREIMELNTKKITTWVQNEITQPIFNQRLVFALVMLYEWYKINIKEDGQ